MLLLGVLAAQAAGVAPAPVAAGDFELIETQTLTTTAASVTFDVTGLGSTYDHLQVRLVARSTHTSDNDNFFIRLNADSGNNYSAHRLQADGSSVYSSGYSSQPDMRNAGVLPANNSTANVFAAGTIDLLDAFNTSKYKVARSLSGSTSKTLIGFTSGSWMNTNAITSVTIDVLSGNFATNSRFSIYGWKAAA